MKHRASFPPYRTDGVRPVITPLGHNPPVMTQWDRTLLLLGQNPLGHNPLPQEVEFVYSARRSIRNFILICIYHKV